MHIIYSSTIFTISNSAEILKLVNPLTCPTHDQHPFVENMILFLPKKLHRHVRFSITTFFLSLQTSPLVPVILNIDA